MLEAATAAIQADDFQVSPALPRMCSMSPTAASPVLLEDTRTVNSELPPMGTGVFLIHNARTVASRYVVVVAGCAAASPGAAISGLTHGHNAAAVRMIAGRERRWEATGHMRGRLWTRPLLSKKIMGRGHLRR